MKTKAIITVLGRDQVGIVARIAAILAENGANIEDISQTIMGEVFSMVMLVTVDDERATFSALQEQFNQAAKEIGVQVSLQREDVFKYMHRI